MICDGSSAHRGDEGAQWELSANGRRAQKSLSLPCQTCPVGNSHLKYTFPFPLTWWVAGIAMTPECEVCSLSFGASPWHTSAFRLSLLSLSFTLKVSKCHRTDGKERIVVFPRLTPPAEQPSLQEWQSSRVTLGTQCLGADGTRQDPSLCRCVSSTKNPT